MQFSKSRRCLALPERCRRPDCIGWPQIALTAIGGDFTKFRIFGLIARSALYLASDASSFTTGTALFADGGVSINRT